jgi:hypothetical protein
MPYLENQELPESHWDYSTKTHWIKKNSLFLHYNILAMNMRLKPTIIATNFVSVDPALS